MRFIKHLIVMSLLLMIIPIDILTNDLDGKFIINNFINHFDSCFPTYLKEKIKGGNRHDFIFSSPLNLDTVSYDEFNEYHHCLKYIDSMFSNDFSCKKYFGDLIVKYPRTIEEIIYKNYYDHLNNQEYDFDKDIDSLWQIKYKIDSMLIAWKSADSINGVYIPASPEEALSILDTLIPEVRINEFKNIQNEEKAVYGEYMGIGLFIRNYWKLGASRLFNYFKLRGVDSHDAISVIILRSWHRRLNGRPINLEEQINKRISK